ncbi:Hypothetical predicted protein [Octopus vulgaris]|uniref:Uncharacterized protein n=1 Tax=Octopus vulgaris TaxID=6645 RepID=A0AA36ARC5_OCTVU|nr:Hypothetical predicted protein [Octopus vulgaris]
MSQSIDGEPKQTVLGPADYDGRYNSLLHITQQQSTRHNSRLPCNSYFQPHQQQQQHLSEQQLLQQQEQQQQQQQQQHQLQRSDYTTTMERSLIIEEDVKMEELQLSEDECQKENQLEQLQPQEIEEQQAMLQPHSHHHNHHHSQEEEQQQQQQYQCDPKRLDVLSSENKIVIPTSSSSLELIEVAPAVSPQPTLNPQAALPSTIHPLSLHKDTQLSISPSLSLNSEGGEQENTHQQQHTPSTAPQQRKQLENNEEGTGSGAAKKLDQEYSVSDNAVETTEPPLNQVTMSTCLNNSVNSETAMNLSNSISISADVSDSNTNTAVAEDLIGPEPISIDRPNELTSLAEEADAAMTTRSPDDINGDQSLPVPLESQSPVSMVTATSPSVVVDQHSSEEELECINQENSHPEKRKWSQMESQSSNSVESNHPKSNVYHSFHPPHHHHNSHHLLQHPLPLHHNSHHQQNHHIPHHHQQQQNNINHNQQQRSSSSSNSGNHGSGGNNNNSNSNNNNNSSSSNNNNNAITSQQHCHNHNNNQHNCSSNSSSNNNNNSILINNSNICNNNNNNNNNNNINSNSNMNNNSNNNSCCFTDSAGSSDEEVKEFMLDPKPILFSSAPPSGIQKVMRSSSANFLVPNGPPLSICAISPRKRHRLNSSSDSLDLENISVIQRPCLDFEKMQKTLMRKHTSHSVSRAKIVKIKTISGNGTSSKCWFDPAVCSFRSISTAYSPLPPVEEPSCAY